MVFSPRGFFVPFSIWRRGVEGVLAEERGNSGSVLKEHWQCQDLNQFQGMLQKHLKLCTIVPISKINL